MYKDYNAITKELDSYSTHKQIFFKRRSKQKVVANLADKAQNK